jgi:hypothetical protein
MATISVTQQPASYTINFVVSSSSYPGTPTFVRIFKNDVLFHTFTGTVGVAYSYTFSEPTIAGSLVYTVDGYANAAAVPANYDSIATTACLVKEYKPTFTLPTITCLELNQPYSFYPTAWNQNTNSLCPVTPLNDQVKYELYEFDMASSSYVAKDDEINPLNDETGAVVGTSYSYNFTPTKLTMLKIVVTVTNCSTSVQKATVFPVCGTWKIRRLACGNYRIYNYKNTNLSYSLYSVSEAGDTQIPTSPIPAFSYATIPSNVNTLLPDGVYKVIADGITQFIFNYCSIEDCMLDLHKRVLLDDSLCDECKLDKVLYQKALRLLPTYETWKKLLDKDWVYDMQYKSTDISGELARIYDAQELYLELIKLCDECSTSTKGCGCGC